MYNYEDTLPKVETQHTLLSVRTKTPSVFEFLLQEGFRVACFDRCTIREFLCIQMQVCGDYTEKRIQTIFLNQKPVDDVDTAIVHEDDTLALSAAMPGVLGATMRKKGYYAKMRSSISHNFGGGKAEHEEGSKAALVKVKLFNFLARELAGEFLRLGVFFPTERFKELLKRQPISIYSDLPYMEINGQKLADPRELAEALPAEPGLLQIKLLEIDD